LFDFRGHYDSDGDCTVGNDEVYDLDAAVRHLHGLGYGDVATLGFSMGAAVTLRHAGAFGGVSAVVAVSGPSRWYYRGTRRMRMLHFGVERPAGRWFLRTARNVRVTDRAWDPVPPDPTELAGWIAPAPLLVVHGDADSYFPLEHPRRIYEAASEPKELWIEPGMGHAERSMTPERADRIAAWLKANRVAPAAPAEDGPRRAGGRRSEDRDGRPRPPGPLPVRAGVQRPRRRGAGAVRAVAETPPDRGATGRSAGRHRPRGSGLTLLGPCRAAARSPPRYPSCRGDRP